MITTAIVAVLAAVAIPGYSKYRDGVNNATAASDIAAISIAIDQFHLEWDRYPDNLNEVNMGGLKDPWGDAYQYLRIDGGKPSTAGKIRKDKSLHPLNTDYDLCSMGKNGATTTQIITKQGKDDIIRANNGKFIALASDY